MDKKYQVFVSSTYEDLIVERQEVMQVLLGLSYMPSGMELFPAADEDQWSLIKQVIDDCDYYIVIIGGRYGSIGPKDISYTQMEYEYAISQNKPVIAFLHKNPNELPASKTERIEKHRKKLEAFRALAQMKMCKYWSSAAELGSMVSQSLAHLTKAKPAIGWVRANSLETLLSRKLREQQLIPAGVGVRDSIYKYSNVIDSHCKELVLTGTNFGDVLGERPAPPSVLHKLIILALKGVNKPTVTIAFAPPDLLKDVNSDGYQDLMKYSMPRMLDLYHCSDLTDEERSRLNIICHTGALFAALCIRDPEDEERGLIVGTPRWVSDTQGIGRMYFVVRKTDNREVFEALYRPIYSDLRVNKSRRDLLDIAKEYNVT